jgi:hypothetical protein
MAEVVARTAPIVSLGLDKLGGVVAALLAIGAASPFSVLRANRIVAPSSRRCRRPPLCCSRWSFWPQPASRS